MKKIKFTFLTMSLLLGGLVVQSAVVKAQEPETKSAEKGEVADLLAKLKKSDERVVERCLEDCEEAKSASVQKVVGGQMLDKPAPTYPTIAKAAHASGDVLVQVIVDENGKVIAAKAIGGHPLLQAASVTAARNATFTAASVDGSPVKVLGTITYRFVLE
jgi:TonB family protein